MSLLHKCLAQKKYFFVLLTLLLSSVLAHAQLSDLSVDSFNNQEQKKSDSGPRDPFAPQVTNDNDVSTLKLEGIVYNPSIQVALVSGKIVREGMALGGFVVKEILPGSVVLQTPQKEERLTIEGQNGTPKDAGPLYEVCFQNASLRHVLQLMASAGRFNIIIPEAITEKVSVTFHQIPLRDALSSILLVNGMVYAEENQVVRVGKAAEFESGSYFNTRQFHLRYATAKDIIPTIKSVLSDKGSVTADDRTNTLNIKDSQSVIDKVDNMLVVLDKADTQVHIEAKIIDARKDFARSIGVQWGFSKSAGQAQGFGVESVGVSSSGNNFNVNLPATGATSGAGVLIGNLFHGTDLDAAITAGESHGDLQVISQPSVTTVNNVSAKIRSGIKLYVKTTSIASSSATSSDLKEIDTGVELTVTPQISTGNTIKLKIEAQESQPDFSNTVDGIPSVLDNSATTTVLVNNGETTVIGGLVQTNKNNSKGEVPGFSKIPLLGGLFKSSTKAKTDNELLIFITPRIVNGQVVFTPPGGASEQPKLPQPTVAENLASEKKARMNRNKYTR